MKITTQSKKLIDSLNYSQLLFEWRFAEIGDPLFEGETGDYFIVRMKELREDIGNECHSNIREETRWER